MNIASMSQYAKHKDGTYVSLEMSSESCALLDNFVKMNLGLEERVDSKTYHTTIIYSRYPVPTAENLAGSIDTDAIATGYEIFPTKTDGSCLVLRIACPKATELNTQLTQQGAISDYDSYKPHITLAYDMKQIISPDSLPLPHFTLKFDRINVAPLDPQFTPSNSNE
jgi:2'-5' RNA ligase